MKGINEYDWTTYVPFPKGKNVRISIAGLATFAFSENKTRPTIVNFPTHVPLHVPKYRIIRRDNNGVLIDDSGFSNVPGNIGIRGDIATLTTYNSSGPLSELINFSKIHKERFFKVPRPANKPPIEVTLHDCAFYIRKLTDNLYTTQLPGQSSSTPQQRAEIISGYIGITGEVLYILGDNTKPLYMNENGQKRKYEIIFINHCEDTDSQTCESVFGNDENSDVKFLYEILHPLKSQGRRMKLKRVKSKKPEKESPNTGACLPIQTEPCDNCT